MHKSMTRLIIGAAAISVLTESGARAQALADIVPPDAIAYVGWRGTLDPGPAYAASHLAAVLKDSKFDDFVDQTLPAMAAAIGQREPNSRALATASFDVLRQSIRHPVALFVTAAAGKPRFAMCVRGGTDSAALLTSIKLLVDQIPPDAKAAVLEQADVVGFSLNYGPGESVVSVDAPPLSTVPLFKTDVAQGTADPSIVGFVDATAARGLLDATLKSQLSAEQFASYQRAMDTAGLSGVHSLAYVAGFSGRDWQFDTFIDAPEPRTGLLATGDGKAFSPDLLKRVPASAYGMSAVRFNAAKAVDQVKAIASAVDPSAGDIIDKALGGATMAIGKNITTDLLEPLGDEWVTYNAPEIGGPSVLGSVVVNKLANPFKEKQGLASLAIFLTNTARTFLHKQGITIAAHTTQIDGVTVNYFATPGVAPAWAVKDGNLYLGLYPQTVIDAMRYDGRAIAENENFARTISGIGGKAPIALSYTDTRQALPDGYATGLLLGQLGVGFGDMFLAPTAEPFFPPLAPVLAEAAPVGTVTWADKTGLHQRSKSPFPAAETLATLSIQNMYLTNVPVMISILLPSLNRAREAANRIKSASNLRQIGLGAMMYANENRGRMPDDLATILKNEDIGADVFVSPRNGAAAPPNLQQMTADQRLAWVNDGSSYVWLGKGLKDGDTKPDQPLAYEKPAGMEDGINILYGDDHVEFVMTQQAMKQLAAAGVENP